MAEMEKSTVGEGVFARGRVGRSFIQITLGVGRFVVNIDNLSPVMETNRSKKGREGSEFAQVRAGWKSVVKLNKSTSLTWMQEAA